MATLLLILSMANIFSNSSGIKTAPNQIYARSSYLCGVNVNPPTTGYTLLTIYDTANGPDLNALILVQIHMDAGMVGVTHEFVAPVIANYGLYCSVTGGTSPDVSYSVRYSAA